MGRWAIMIKDTYSFKRVMAARKFFLPVGHQMMICFLTL